MCLVWDTDGRSPTLFSSKHYRWENLSKVIMKKEKGAQLPSLFKNFSIFCEDFIDWNKIFGAVNNLVTLNEDYIQKLKQ